jgi:hypothetical protein
MAFDTATLAALRSDKEVRIHTGKKAGRGVIIWVVVVDDTVYVRSVRGPTGKWFVAAKAAGRAEVEVGQHRAPVRVTSVDDARTIDVSAQIRQQPLCEIDGRTRDAADNAAARPGVIASSPPACGGPAVNETCVGVV